MKKLIYAVIVVIVAMLAACAQADGSDAPTIKPTEFSEETIKVLDLMDDEIMFFDYTVDETIKSTTIDAWVYKDGEWESVSRSYRNVSKADNQVAFRYIEPKFELYVIDETGHVKSTSPEMPVGFADTKHQISTRLQQPTKIALNTEIPLWVKIGNNDDRISIDDNFRDSNCTAGIAVTITFSDKTLE